MLSSISRITASSVSLEMPPRAAAATGAAATGAAAAALAPPRSFFPPEGTDARVARGVESSSGFGVKSSIWEQVGA